MSGRGGEGEGLRLESCISRLHSKKRGEEKVTSPPSPSSTSQGQSGLFF